MAKQAEAERDLDIKKANYLEASKKAQGQADKAYEIETNRQQQTVMLEQVRIQQVERQAQVKVQEAEISRRERELIATVLKQAEIERQRIETIANAERQRLISEAEGRPSSIRAQGEAEAEIIFKKGEAEAHAMNVKAEAFQEYNQAAVLDKLITGLPEVVRALSEPLSKVDKVRIVSTGNGDAAGAYKLTGDITKIAEQLRSGTSLTGDFKGGKGHESDDATEAGTVLGNGDTHHANAEQCRLGPDQHRTDTLFRAVLKFA